MKIDQVLTHPAQRVEQILQSVRLAYERYQFPDRGKEGATGTPRGQTGRRARRANVYTTCLPTMNIPKSGDGRTREDARVSWSET